MSYSHPNPSLESGLYADADAPRFVGESAAQRGANDHAIELALRDVPLPQGFMTRLGKLAYVLPEAPSDQVDWLGC